MNANRTERLEVATGTLSPASSAVALVLGAVVLALAAVCVPLTVLTRDFRISDDGLLPVTVLAFAVVGVVVARRQPRNAIGWILLAAAVVAMFDVAARLYLVLDYRIHHGALPLGRAVVYWAGSKTLLPILIALPAILLFPDGRVPSRRWRRALWTYVALAVFFMAVQFVVEAQVIGGPVQLQVSGEPSSANPTGPMGLVNDVAWLTGPLFVAFAVSFVGCQGASWRRSTAERREQLKWLMSGGAICVISFVAIVVSGNGTSVTARVVNEGAAVGIAALPVSIGIGVLKYRLYEIDRLISRTLSYAILTGLLVGAFVGIVALTTRVLPFSSPVGVAASTLAAAALFNPLRWRAQRLVDRKFNRARYDAEATVAAFTARLQDAVDIVTVRDELLQAVELAVEPSGASLWIRTPSPSPRA